MTATPHRMLFIGFDASRTGAPLLLLHFLRWLAANSSIQFEILLCSGGELEAQYARLAPTRVLHRPSTRSDRFWRRVRRTLGLQRSLASRLDRFYPAANFPLIYANTVAHGEIVGIFGRQGRRLICHAHEMRFAIARWGGEAAKVSSKFVHEFIAASLPVKHDLMAQWDVAGERIAVIQEFGQPMPAGGADPAAVRARLRASFKFTADDRVVGLCGTLDWRKGADLLPLLARIALDQSDETRLRFVWIGGFPSDLERMQVEHDLQTMGLQNYVTLVGSVPNSQEIMTAFDIFALPSREDPCPLVMLEAAALGLPIVCFAQSGGAPDFVRSDAGIVVPYLDVAAMAAALVSLADDPLASRKLGAKARERASAEFALETQAPRLLAVIERHWQ